MKEQENTFIVTEHFILLTDARHLTMIEDSEDKWMRVLVCTGGEMSLDVEGRKVSLQCGNILFCSYEQKLEHIMISPDFKFMMFSISKYMNTEIFPNSAKIWKQFHNFRIDGKISLPLEELNEVIYDFEYLVRRLSESDMPYYNDYCRCLVQSMFYRVAAKISAPPVSEPTQNTDILQTAELLAEAFFNLLNSTYPTPRAVEWYATRLNKTPNYLSTVIKRISGRNPMEWITEKTVNEIAYLLKNSTQSVKEISAQLNFSSLSFFCRYVRRHLGVSPNHYRSLSQ